MRCRYCGVDDHARHCACGRVATVDDHCEDCAPVDFAVAVEPRAYTTGGVAYCPPSPLSDIDLTQFLLDGAD